MSTTDFSSVGATSAAHAAAAARAMFMGDHIAAQFGMTLEEVNLGYARLSISICADMTQAHGTCHGGVIYALADATFGVACNSYEVSAVAQQCSITYLAPVQVGDTLIAEAREIARRGRSGLYDVQVRKPSGEVVAEFRGHCRVLSSRDDAPR
jgi:acyl-CoA thioesterase